MEESDHCRLGSDFSLFFSKVVEAGLVEPSLLFHAHRPSNDDIFESFAASVFAGS